MHAMQFYLHEGHMRLAQTRADALGLPEHGDMSRQKVPLCTLVSSCLERLADPHNQSQIADKTAVCIEAT
jgi:hypothetical protein